MTENRALEITSARAWPAARPSRCSPANGKFVVGDCNVHGLVYMSAAGRALVYGEMVGTNFVKSAKVRKTTLRRTGEFLTGNGVDEIRLVDIRGRLVR